MKTWPLNGSAPMICCAFAARPSKPARRSIGWQARKTFVPGGRAIIRAPLPTTLNYYLAIHSNDSFWTVQKDQASLSAVLPTTPRRPVQTGRLRHADGYAWFNELFAGGKIAEAACRAHVRRKFFDVHA